MPKSIKKNVILEARSKRDRQDLATIDEARIIAGHTHEMIDHFVSEITRKCNMKK